MSNVEQAAEPTMEEILSSIRKIISDADQDEPLEASEPAAAAQPEPEPEPETGSEPEPEIGPEAAPEPEPVAEEPSVEEAADDIFELTEVAPEEAGSAAAADEMEESPELIDPDAIDDLTFVASEGEPVAEEAAGSLEQIEDELIGEPASEGAPTQDGDGLLSVEADSAVSAAFGSLTETMLSRNGNSRTLEDLVQEMLRPMLKGWLDESLPDIVERLVREEIERVTRKR